MKVADQRSDAKTGVNPVGAAIVGAAVGATAAALADKKNRKIVKTKVSEFLSQAEKAFDEFRERMDHIRERIVKESELENRRKSKLRSKKES
jgi:hypothetical protein